METRDNAKEKKKLNDFHNASNRRTLAARDYVAPLQNAVINKKIKLKTTRRKFIHKNFRVHSFWWQFWLHFGENPFLRLVGTLLQKFDTLLKRNMPLIKTNFIMKSKKMTKNVITLHPLFWTRFLLSRDVIGSVHILRYYVFPNFLPSLPTLESSIIILRSPPPSILSISCETSFFSENVFSNAGFIQGLWDFWFVNYNYPKQIKTVKQNNFLAYNSFTHILSRSAKVLSKHN